MAAWLPLPPWRVRIASVLCVLYVAFALWYTPLRGPLSAADVEHYVALFAESGGDKEGLRRLRQFLETDTGRSFGMVNVIELREPPQQVAGVSSTDSASQVLAKYMEYMWPALLRRACHPVIAGSTAAASLDVWGIEGAGTWSQAAVMRYRSRRDLMEISSNPAFAGPHEFKVAAMSKTIAFPIDPWFHAGDPRLLGGLLLLLAVLVLRPWRSRGHGPDVVPSKARR